MNGLHKRCWLIVGSGNMANRHVEHVRFLYPDSKIIRFSSSFYSQENSFSEEKTAYVKNLDLALDCHPHFAIIANAAPFHCEIAEKLIKKGVPILIEKPLSDTYEKASALLEISRAYPDCLVLVGYHLRYKPGFSYLQKILKEGVIGNINFARASVGHYLPLWRPQDYENSVSAKKKLGGGVLLELSHEFDYVKALFGEPMHITCVADRVSNLKIDVEDIALSIFQYRSGFVVSIHQDMISRPPHRKLEVCGDKGSLVWDIRNDRIEVYNYSKASVVANFDSKIKQSRELYLAEIMHFVECVDFKIAPKVSLEDACVTMKMIELAKNYSEFYFK